MEQYDIIIVGSGPAGMSTALHLVQADPDRASRLVVLEKAVHPREKLCAGGVTRPGEEILTNLGLSFEPDNVPVREVRIVFHDTIFAIRDNPVFRIVCRKEFDHWLAQRGEQRGITIRQGEAVKAVIPRENLMEVVTERGTCQAQVVVAADGSCSTVRQSLGMTKRQRKARTLELVTPESLEQSAFSQSIAIYDFTHMTDGLQGYCWDFPGFIKGQPFMNRGIFDSRTRPGPPRHSIYPHLEQTLQQRGKAIQEHYVKGFPIQWFDPQTTFSRPHLLFAGDAAGVDPLFGEGISFALGYGEVAAAAILHAFEQHDFRFSGYKARIVQHPLLKQLRVRKMLAHLAYMTPANPYFATWLWRFIPVIYHLLAWYGPAYIPVEHPQLIRLR